MNRRATTRSCAAHRDYTAGCEGCRAVARRYAKARELGLVGGRINSTGTTRRLRALGRMGWSSVALGAHLGVSQQKVCHWQVGRAAFVFEPTARRVARLYDRLSMTDGGSRRARLRAEREGWPPPLAWDDDTIDDPGATPDLGSAEYPNRRVHVEDVDWLVRTGAGKDEISARLGVTWESVERACYRARRGDLVRAVLAVAA